MKNNLSAISQNELKNICTLSDVGKNPISSSIFLYNPMSIVNLVSTPKEIYVNTEIALTKSTIVLVFVDCVMLILQHDIVHHKDFS